MGMLRTIAINLAILAVLFGIAEIAYRSFATTYPIGGAFLDAETGSQIRLLSLDPAQSAEPNLSFIHVASEFRAAGETTELGFRKVLDAPAEEAETVAFLGDSFTWGHGVASGDTFADLYCQARQLRCLNLSRPGYGQRQELRLVEALAAKGAPPIDRLMLFPMVTCALESAGNDLGQNLHGATEVEVAAPPEDGGGTLGTIRNLLYSSKLMKALLQGVVSQFRADLAHCSAPEDIALALTETLALIDRIEAALHSANPEAVLQVYLISPLWEMSNGAQAAAAFAEAATRPAPLLTRAEPADYFPVDGHLNEQGHRYVADRLLALTGG